MLKKFLKKKKKLIWVFLKKNKILTKKVLNSRMGKGKGSFYKNIFFINLNKKVFEFKYFFINILRSFLNFEFKKFFFKKKFLNKNCFLNF